MIEVTDKSKCCGCTACMAICSKDAITMQPDAMGFLYPVVNNEKCIDCGQCEKVCAFNEHYDRSDYFGVPLVFGARNKDKTVVENSQSGGLFYTLAKWVIENSGIVYGAGFKTVYEVIHKRVETLKELDELRGSKYVQSNLQDTFLYVIKDLKAGKLVLFSGTGCQVAGLHALMRQTRTNDNKLILCDIICHGVPSPYVWKENVMQIEKQNRAKVGTAIFRNKRLFGWHNAVSSYQLDNGKIITSDLYYKAFGFNCINRQACGICFFSNLHRPGDITIGDFWELNKINQDLDNDNLGVSLVLINNLKGQNAFNVILSELQYFKSNTIDCMQPNVQSPSAQSPFRDQFEKDFVSKGYTYAMRRLKGFLSNNHGFFRLFFRKIKDVCHVILAK